MAGLLQPYKLRSSGGTDKLSYKHDNAPEVHHRFAFVQVQDLKRNLARCGGGVYSIICFRLLVYRRHSFVQIVFTDALQLPYSSNMQKELLDFG